MVVKKDWGGGEGGVGVVWIVLRQSNGRTVCGFHGLSGRDNMVYGLDARTGMLIAA